MKQLTVKYKDGKKYYVDQDGKKYVELTRCPHCGATNVMSAPGTKICQECFNAYGLYMYTKRCLNTRPESLRQETLRRHRDAILFYMGLRQSGVTIRVPQLVDLKSELAYVNTLIDR